jgi:hypothetical protein
MTTIRRRAFSVVLAIAACTWVRTLEAGSRRFLERGYEAASGSPKALVAMQQEEARKWGEVIRRAGIRP